MYYTPEDKANWDRVVAMLEETLDTPSQRPFFN